MYDSILLSIKKLLGIAAECTDFDPDIIMHINTTFMILNQLGVGTESYFIDGPTNTWSEFIKSDADLIAVKTYIYSKVRLMFDPPINSTVVQALKDNVAELEFRLQVACDIPEKRGDN